MLFFKSSFCVHVLCSDDFTVMAEFLIDLIAVSDDILWAVLLTLHEEAPFFMFC